MYDYIKIWIHDVSQIGAVLKNPLIKSEYLYDENYVLKGVSGIYKNWKLKTLSPSCLEVAGSIHKYWNNGTNENDFPFSSVKQAIIKLCNELKIAPQLAFIKNLEFGVNIQPSINASEIIDQVICFKNKQPLRPYDMKSDCYFIEFEASDYFLKVYDKGLQYQKQVPNITNTLRLEVKSMNRGFPNFAKIHTLQDLLYKESMIAVGVNWLMLFLDWFSMTIL